MIIKLLISYFIIWLTPRYLTAQFSFNESIPFSINELLIDSFTSFDFQIIDIDNDHDLDIVVRSNRKISNFSYNTEFAFYENISNGSLAFDFNKQLLSDSTQSIYHRSRIVDFNANGDFEYITWILEGGLNFSSFFDIKYRDNEGMNRSTWVDLDNFVYAYNLMDYDKDGDIDILTFGGGDRLPDDSFEDKWQFKLFENQSDQPDFTFVESILLELTSESAASIDSIPIFNYIQRPNLTDVDEDGDLDIMSSVIVNQGPYLNLTNIEIPLDFGYILNKDNLDFVKTRIGGPFSIIDRNDTTVIPRPLEYVDFDNDGDLDVLTLETTYSCIGDSCTEELETYALYENHFSTSTGFLDNKSTTQANTFNLKVFPNPTKDQVNISFDNNESKTIAIQIVDILGKVIQSVKTNKNHFVLGTSVICHGSYFVVLTVNNQVFMTKLIVE